MAEAYGPTTCPSSLALESTLSRSLEAQYGFRLKLCHQSAKTIALAGLKTKFGAAVFLASKASGVFSFSLVEIP